MTKRKSWVACIYRATKQHYAASITLLAESMISPLRKKKGCLCNLDVVYRYGLRLFDFISKGSVKVWNGFYAFIEISHIILFVG